MGNVGINSSPTNADTLDGLYESNFLQNLGSWTNGAVKDLILAATKSGFIWISNNVTGMPTAGATWWFGILDCSNTSHRCLQVNSVSNRYRYSIVYNDAEGWTDWVKTNDGGNADTIGGMLPADLMKNTSPWSSGNIKDLLLAAESCCVFISSDVTGMPIDGTYWFGIVNASTTHRHLSVYQIDGRYSGFIAYNSGNNKWHEWTPFSGSVSNPNLLINPDFKINQRGQSEYTSAGYTVDRWAAQPNCKVTPKSSGGVRLDCLDVVNSGFYQEYDGDLSGNTVTLSIKASGSGTLRIGIWDTSVKNVTLNDTPAVYSHTFEIGNDTRFGMWLLTNGEYAEIEWVKAEIGSVATPFCPPEPATELVKCQRYYQKLFPNDLPSGLLTRTGAYFLQCPIHPNMRIRPTVNYHWNYMGLDTNSFIVDGNNATCSAQYSTSWYTSEKMLHIDITSNASTNLVYIPRNDDGTSYCELDAEL